MQPAYIVPAAEWDQFAGRLAALEAAHQAHQAPPPPPDEVLTTAQAAAYIGLSADALLRARRAGRLQGVRLNNKDWGFRRSVIDKYPRRYARPTSPAA